MENKHTPGPWDTKGIHKYRTDFCVFGPSGRFICSTGGYSDGRDSTYDENKANAEFIALACKSHYELLDALEWLKSNYEQTLSGVPVRDADECISMASAAIAKARGQS